MTKCVLDRNMAIGVTRLNKKKEIIGQNLPDPFLDSYTEESFCLTDIINLMDKVEGASVNLLIDKGFLRKIVHSHILFIREIENTVNGKKYDHTNHLRKR